MVNADFRDGGLFFDWQRHPSIQNKIQARSLLVGHIIVLMPTRKDINIAILKASGFAQLRLQPD